MLSTFKATMPELSKQAKTDLEKCLNLFVQNNYNQSEIEFEELFKNHINCKQHLVTKALSFFFDVYVHEKHQNIDLKIQYFMKVAINDSKCLYNFEAVIDKRNLGQTMVPYILIKALMKFGRMDKAAEICKIYLDGVNSNSYWLNKFYFNAMIQLFDFDDQAKFALKLYQMDKSETNKFQVCIAIFLQAITKLLKKEREVGLEFCSKLALKVFASDKPEYLKKYLEAVQKAKFFYTEKPFLEREGFIQDLVKSVPALKDKSDKGSAEEYSKLAGELARSFAENEEYDDTINQMPSYDDSSLKNMYEIFVCKMEALRLGPRSHDNWGDAIAVMLAIKAADCHSNFAMFLQELQNSNNGLEKEDLIACIKFLRSVPAAEQYNLGTPAERLDEYFERYGHQFNANATIYDWFSDLIAEEKKHILINSKKILGILIKFIDKFFEGGIITEIIDARIEITEPRIIKAFGRASIPADTRSLIFFCYNRMLLTDKLQLLSPKVSSIEIIFIQLVNKWIKSMDFLANVKFGGHFQLLIQQITEACYNALTKLSERFDDNNMYLEILTCFLKRQCDHAVFSTSNLLVQLFDSQNKLGFAKEFQKYNDENQKFSIHSTSNYIFENSGRFHTARAFYEKIVDHQSETLNKIINIMKKCYISGEVERTLVLHQSIHQQQNYLYTSRQFSRDVFLKALIAPSLSSFCDFFFKSAWPTELPIASEMMTENEYFEAITEIKTIRILCHFLVIFNEYKSDGTAAAAAFESLLQDLKYYLSILPSENLAVGEEKVNQPVITTSNMFENAVIQSFMKLINIYVESVASILSHSDLSVTGILQKLPNISKFRAYINEVLIILHDLYKQKFKNAHRIRASADAAKMAIYMSRLIAVTYEALAKYLNVKVEDFQIKNEYKTIYIRFRQYAVELKLLMEVMASWGRKWIGHLSNCQRFFPDQPTAATVSAIRAYVQTQFSEYKEAFQGMMQYRFLPSLIEVGLISKPKPSQDLPA